ncbi:shikimate dehydrogenase [Bartonella sp. DGB1]|uniref:shikimate dehydrogenase n=1 Tax=Bartonella sp. DGB1 TaxID=3239807 RepID=UPI00352592DD
MQLFLIGTPIKHSLSPLIHNYWLKKYNINASYTAINVKEQEFLNFTNNFKNNFFAGNITSPYKEKIIDFLDFFDPLVQEINVCNCVKIFNNKVYGYNTDIFGFSAAIKKQKKIFNNKIALIIGAGGAARAIIYALYTLGFSKLYIVNRSENKIYLLQQLFKHKINIINWNQTINIEADLDLVVNTTSVGLANNDNNYSKFFSLEMKQLKKDCLIVDLNYNPSLPLFLQEAKKYNLPILNGLDMLIYQAQESFLQWFGIKPLIDNKLKGFLKCY